MDLKKYRSTALLKPATPAARTRKREGPHSEKENNSSAKAKKASSAKSVRTPPSLSSVMKNLVKCKLQLSCVPGSTKHGQPLLSTKAKSIGNVQPFTTTSKASSQQKRPLFTSNGPAQPSKLKSGSLSSKASQRVLLMGAPAGPLPEPQCQSTKHIKSPTSFKDKLLSDYQSKFKPIQKILSAEWQSKPIKMKKSESTRLQQVDPVDQYLDHIKKSPLPAKPRKNELRLSRFKLGKKLGKGRFGEVYMAQDRATGFMLALKKVSKKGLLQSKMVGQLIQEIKIQGYSKHPNILQTYGFFSDSQNIYLMLELADGGNLFRQLRGVGRFEQPKAAYYLRQVVEGLAFLHQEGVIHRDIKPENILHCHGTVKLSDFGWSVYSPQRDRQTFCGTLDYVSPDMVMGKKYDEKADLWSIGVLCYEFCSGRAPFQSKQSQNDVYEKILHAKCRYPEHLSQGAKDFISRLLVKEPSLRMPLSEALKCTWLESCSREGFSFNRSVFYQMTGLLQ